MFTEIADQSECPEKAWKEIRVFPDKGKNDDPELGKIRYKICAVYIYLDALFV